jgi:hypothetical protein
VEYTYSYPYYKSLISRPKANDRLLTPLKLLHVCPERHQAYAQASNQMPQQSLPRQTCQHSFLFRLAVPLPKTFTHFMFVHKDVWIQSVSSFSRSISLLTAYSSVAARLSARNLSCL